MRWKVKIFNIVRIVAAIEGKCGEQKQQKRLSSSNVDTTINDVFFFLFSCSQLPPDYLWPVFIGQKGARTVFHPSVLTKRFSMALVITIHINLLGYYLLLQLRYQRLPRTPAVIGKTTNYINKLFCSKRKYLDEARR